MKQRRRFLSIIVLVLSSLPLVGENYQDIIPYNSPIVQNLEHVYSELGLAMPSDTAPWTRAEIMQLFDRVLEYQGKLSAAALGAVMYIRGELESDYEYSDPSGAFDFDVDLDLNLEAYLGFGEEDEREWRRGYGEREPLLFMPFSVYLYDSFFASTDITLMEDPFTVLERQGSGTTLPSGFNDLDSHYPYHASMVYGGDHWNVQFARETLNWGKGKTGNLLLSDNGVVHDYIKISTFWDKFKFTFLWSGQDNYTWDFIDVDGDGVYEPLEGDEYRTWSTPTQNFYIPVQETEGDGISAQEAYRHFLAHRLEFRPFSKLGITLTEAVMYQDPSFQVRYLNPMMIFHNWYQKGSANYFMSLEADYSPVPGINIYGQFLGDQIAFHFNRQSDTSLKYPPGMGYLLGMDLSRAIGPGYLFGGVEWVKLDPFNYIDRSGTNLWYERHIISNYYGGRHLLLIVPLGYEKGPDSLTWYAEAGYRVPGAWEVTASGEYFLKGENTILDSWSDDEGDADKQTPSGENPIAGLVLGLAGEVQAETLGIPWNASAGAELNVINMVNFNHEQGNDFWDVQVSLFATYSF